MEVIEGQIKVVADRLDIYNIRMENISTNLAELLTTVKFIMENTTIGQPSNQINNVQSTQLSSEVDLCANLFPIKTVEALDELEEKLNDTTFKNQLKEQLIRLHDTDMGIGFSAKQTSFDLNKQMFSNELNYVLGQGKRSIPSSPKLKKRSRIALIPFYYFGKS